MTSPSLPAELLSPVLQSLLAELALLPPRIDAYASGLALLPPAAQDAPDLEHVDHCLRIIDAFLLGLWGRPLGRDPIEEKRQPLGQGLIAVCLAAAMLDTDDEWRSLGMYAYTFSFSEYS